MSNKLKTIHQSLWSAIAMLLVLTGATIGVFLLFHHDHMPSDCPDGVRQVYYRTVTSYDTSYDPPSRSGISHIPVFVCQNGNVVNSK